jgi:type I restriction enzyme S subunit
MDKNWEIKKIREFAEIQYGLTAKSNKIGQYHYVRITDIQNGEINWNNVPKVNTSNEILAKYVLNTGDILFARSGATAGKSYLVDSVPKDAVFASYLIRVICNNQIVLPEFLYLYFQTYEYWENISYNTAGIAQPNVNGTKLGAMDVPLPPLQEQKQIVSKIKECFTLLDKSEEKLKQAEDKLNKVMDSALERLIPDTLPEEDDRWEIKSLGDIFQVYTGKTPKTKEKLYYTNQDIPFVGPSDLPDSEIVITKANKYIDKYAIETGVVRLLPKDTVLLCCIGATIGKVGIAEVELTTNQQINSFIPNPKFDMKYLYFYLRKIRSLITTESSSTTMPILNKSKTENLPFIYPQDISRQKAISKKLEKLKTYSDESIRRLQGQKAFIKSLRQSILKKAFEGKLI